MIIPEWKKKKNTTIKAINSFHIDKSFGSDKDRGIRLLNNSQIILGQ